CSTRTQPRKRCRPCSSRRRTLRRRPRRLRPAPAAEDEAAEGQAEAERPDREGSERDRLARGRETLPVSEHLFLFGGQRLAAALLAHRSARAQAEVEVVEDF